MWNSDLLFAGPRICLVNQKALDTTVKPPELEVRKFSVDVTCDEQCRLPLLRTQNYAVTSLLSDLNQFNALNAFDISVQMLKQVFQGWAAEQKSSHGPGICLNYIKV